MTPDTVIEFEDVYGYKISVFMNRVKYIRPSYDSKENEGSSDIIMDDNKAIIVRIPYRELVDQLFPAYSIRYIRASKE